MGFWIFTLVFYSVVAVTVIRWSLLSALGLWVCTPQLFIKYPTAYKLLPLVLLVVAASEGLISNVPWYLVVVVILVVRTISLWIGKKLAFAKVRKEYAEFSEPGGGWDPATASDGELWDMAKKRLKYDPNP